MGNDDASSSSDFMYDVFLISFSKGNSYAFTGHLYHALQNNGINTVRCSDNETDTDIVETIEKSRISMVVLCQNYARSTRCLHILVKIIECYDAKGKQVSVIFHNIVEWNSYAAAMIEYEENLGEHSDQVKAWRSALSRIGHGHLAGEYCTDEYESGFINKVIRDTFAKLPPPPVPLEIKHPVGLDSHFEELKSLLDIESNDDAVCMLGIYGDAGIGKTTFAAYLYNKVRDRFEAGSFLANVKEKSNNSGLEDLKRTLLYETVKEVVGSQIIKHKLSHKKVVLILDDVDRIEQLEALAGECDWFGSGSLIIITTRDETLLDKHDIAIKKYKMEELSFGDSLQLFCGYAFNMSEPAENYADISAKVVSYAKGFPRALKVLGSNLKGLSVEEWEMELEKYTKVPDTFHFLIDSF